MKEKFENYTREEIDFKIKDLYEIVWPNLKQLLDQDIILSIESNFDDKINIKIRQAIIRFVFLIELVKVPKIETTKVRVRWFSQLNEDPRHCSFEECCQIFVSVYQQLSVWLLEERNKKLLIDQINNSLISYEIPLDYINRPELGNRIHTVDNIEWVRDEEYFTAISLRKYLLCNLEYEVNRKFFKDVLTKKIKVKTYLTDRVLTGDYKTNREKRWEVHPNSVHFALRKTCIAIEHKLTSQIFSFDNFPTSLKEQMVSDGYVTITENDSLCPVTGGLFDYIKLLDELRNPVMGKSDFQVGHMNPLKFDSVGEESGKHEASNIGWISADGNRIQGSMSLTGTRNMIKKIKQKYDGLGW